MTLLVGTDATTDLRTTRFKWITRDPEGIAALSRFSNSARRYGISMIALFLMAAWLPSIGKAFEPGIGVANTGVPNVGVVTTSTDQVSAEPVRVSGNVIYRWAIGTSQASLLEGDCVLQHGDKRITAESILVIVSGDVGRVRSEVVLDGIPLPNGTRSGPRIMEFVTLMDPEVQAPLYRGAPDQTPRLLQYRKPSKPPRLGFGSGEVAFASGRTSGLGESGLSGATHANHHESNHHEPVGSVQQIQYQSIPLEQPNFANPVFADPGIDSGAFQPAQQPQQQVLSGPSNWSVTPTETPPQVSFDLAPGSLLPSDGLANSPPPITMSDGATSGGFQFFVGGGTRSVEVLARGSTMPPQLETINRPESGETVIIARGGVTVLVRDVTAQLPSGELMQLGTISLSADRIVAWLPLVTNLFNGSANLSQAQGELYLEGDIVVRQGERIIYAESMYYNIATEQGIVLDAEAITTIPSYQGIVRLKADVMQQVSRGNFVAFDAAVTSSRMGVPRYWLQSEQLQLTDRNTTVADPITGLPTVRRDPFVSSRDNFTYFGGVPILYWPRFATSLREPTFYLSGASARNDSIFGTQLLLDFNLLQILGIDNPPEGLKWELSTDYLSDRGPALGTTLNYQLPGMFGVPGPTQGYFDAWGIDDDGTDTLGGDRKNLPPEETYRGRVFWQHRQIMPNDYELIAELGFLSDRNFLEQYYEQDWDQRKNQDTSLRLRKYWGSNLLELSAQAQVNDFFQETEQLPALDHYLIGGSLFADLLTWSAHNQISYSRLNAADTATNPAEAATMSTLPGEQDRSGIVARTRQELSLPVQTGPIKVVPYISGEAAHYGEASDGDSLTRLLGQGGVRASLPMSRVDPTIQSSLLNIRGLAHKLEWKIDYFYADSDTSLDELPLYDPLDDHSQQQFRRRFITSDYAGMLPATFDPRTYALRHGTQKYVVSGSDVIADDLQQVRLGLDQRFQTKRGLPGLERIVDVFHFNTDVLLFPEADRDNFGETIGPATFDTAYHIGDRVSLLSDGYFDFFDSGLRSVSAGVRTSRPGVGDIYLGLLSLEGPISSTVFRSTMDYRLNEKWLASSGMTYDFGETGNIGQSFGITRIGESFLVRMGINVDSGRDNVGFGFTIEPRFWPSSRLGNVGGQLIPPPGVEGLE
ncbi:LPS-assembly protein LptD [Novipirellula caenicola]|uniref:LPS-assembly protein LptD n=2 Tax=Novipirellula caenicola TaxID=1536901 RepID=A0ABP9VXR8_9BACT